jgi:hypothetical protein
VAFLRRMERKIPRDVLEDTLRSDSALYNRRMVEFCEKRGWQFSLTADQTAPLGRRVEPLSEKEWQEDPKDRFLVRRKKKESKGGKGCCLPLWRIRIMPSRRTGEERLRLVWNSMIARGKQRGGLSSSVTSFCVICRWGILWPIRCICCVRSWPITCRISCGICGCRRLIARSILTGSGGVWDWWRGS